MSVSMVQPCPEDEESHRDGALQATIAALEAEVANLKVALSSARTIGIALGIIMAERKITSDEAFDILRVISQHSHRKLRDIAEDVGLTGVVPDTPSEASCGCQTVVVACPECGRPATLAMFTVNDRHHDFDFNCPMGHQVPAAQAQELWVAAHQ